MTDKETAPAAIEAAPAPAAIATDRALTEAQRKERIDASVSMMQLLQEAMGKALISGTDYGVIPGTDRPSLWQPGAEKIRVMFSLSAPTTIVDRHEDYDADIFVYTAECIVTDHAGRMMSSFSAVCSSEEPQYRNAMTKPKWKAGQQIPDSSEPISAASQVQTLMAMSQKRAFVGGVKRVAAASQIFSMDDDVAGVSERGGGGRQRQAEDDQGHGVCPLHGKAFRLSEAQANAGFQPSHKWEQAPRGWCEKSSAESDHRRQEREEDSEHKEALVRARTALELLFPTDRDRQGAWMREHFADFALKGYAYLTIGDWNDVAALAEAHDADPNVPPEGGNDDDPDHEADSTGSADSEAHPRGQQPLVQ